MLDDQGEVETEHSSNPVPLIIISANPADQKIKLRDNGSLQDVTPTILSLLGLPKPSEMTGQSLVETRL
jgi:2,3-bisphosphoglycerate-independent phosphoglycerate mutase